LQASWDELERDWSLGDGSSYGRSETNTRTTQKRRQKTPAREQEGFLLKYYDICNNSSLDSTQLKNPAGQILMPIKKSGYPAKKNDYTLPFQKSLNQI
jgi:hypothetical protein